MSRKDIKDVFIRYSIESEANASELKALVTSIGGDAEDSDSFTGAIHRGWIDLKAAIAGNEEAAVLNECERGDDSAKKMYKQALQKHLPDPVRATVQKQYDGVLAAHDHVKLLRDAFNDQKANTARGGL